MKIIILIATLLTSMSGVNTPNTQEKPFVEVIDAKIKDNDGNAVDKDGYYIKYDSRKFKKWDNAKTILVYNPCTSYIDDIVFRIDMEVK